MRAWLGVAVVVAVVSVSPFAVARSLCNQENMAKYAGWCLDAKQELSDFQKSAVGDIIKGRYCGKGELVRDGLFRCLGHDAEALKNILACSSDDTLNIATGLLAADDGRKPQDCSAK